MTTVADFSVETFTSELGEVEIIANDKQRKRLSKDFHWFSPVLKEFFADYEADVVVKPTSEEQIAQVVKACVRHDVPLTMRGSGTGNYGQSTPLFGGVVMDMSALKQPLWLEGGVARVQAGIRLADIDKWARPRGWEMRMMSSTFRLATAGGFFGGGFGGVGTITYGRLGERGNVLGARVMTVEEEPRVLELRGDDALDLHHAYGTNGIVLELEFAMAPALPWAEALIAFDDFMDAARFGQALGEAGGVVKRLDTVLADPIPQMIGLDEYAKPGQHLAIVIVCENAMQPLAEIAAEHRGTIVKQVAAGDVTDANTVIEYTWNHTTLRALKEYKDVTYLQSGFRAGKNLEQIAHMVEHFGDEVPMHLEFLNIGGMITCSGIQIVRYTTRERLDEIIEYHEAHDVHIANPHTHILEDGHNKGEFDPRQLACKKAFDPKGLLNPGKMRAWGEVTELEGA